MLLKGKFCFVLIVLFSLNSCVLFQKATNETELYGDLRNAVKLHLEEAKKTNNILIENASFSLESDKNVSAKITLYAERGKLIFGSVRFLGFEIARLKITTDSLFYINRLKREYIFTDNKQINKSTGFNIDFKVFDNMIFTGFPDPPNKKNHVFFETASIHNDTVYFPYKINADNNINAEYSFPDLSLVKMTYSDIPGMTRANVDVYRKGKEIEKIMGIIQKELFLAKFEMEVDEIRNTKYSKTTFKVGRNYKEATDIF